MKEIKIEPIAYIFNNFTDKFGIPRQSNLIKDVESTIIFDDKYKDENALRGLMEYSHIWLIWYFSDAESSREWSPTVRPPRLGGNKRMGVFSTRSPFHPNRLGLSCVELCSVEKTSNDGTVIKVKGADLMSGTPIIDIKPYLSFTDSIPNALCGFADTVLDYELNVFVPENIQKNSKISNLKEIIEILKQDPRPSYQNDPKRIYGIIYGEHEIKFKVDENTVFVESIESRTDVKNEKTDRGNSCPC